MRRDSGYPAAMGSKRRGLSSNFVQRLTGPSVLANCLFKLRNLRSCHKLFPDVLDCMVRNAQHASNIAITKFRRGLQLVRYQVTFLRSVHVQAKSMNLLRTLIFAILTLWVSDA